MSRRALQIGLFALARGFSHPYALIATAFFVAAWAIFERETLDWHGAATIITLVMAIVIERNQAHDTRALQAKLDELIHATAGAHDELAELERRDPEEAEEVVKKARPQT